MSTARTFWRDRPVFVTGATGLVGTWVVKHLIESGAVVTCLTRDWVPQSEFVRSGLATRCNMVQGDLCDMALMERTLGEYEIRTVLHLAAQTQVGVANRNPVGTFETNVAGTWRLLEACRRTPTIAQIVVASSDKAYGEQEVLPYDENGRLEGRNPYDVSKSCAALLAYSYWHTYRLPVCVTYCGNFYGPGDVNWSRLVPGTVRSVFRGERPIIRSDGLYTRDYFFVKDGAAANCLLAEKMEELPQIVGQGFNFSNERQDTVLDLVRVMLRLMGRDDLQPVIQNQATHEIRHQRLSAKKARELLGWRPLWDLEAALKETIAWYETLLKNG
ncbi:MAG: NAD-dependent epimerase/dehydratase family protein [Nitrospira sp.]|nr:NAD-dependent epimerase/dehydratase family protein [Nitrospira sp.]